MRRKYKISCTIGFGISTPKQDEEMARLADGIIVGSAIVKIIGELGEGAVNEGGKYIASMKQAVPGKV